MTWQLKDSPDWYAAAQSLVNGCAVINGLELRVQFLERLCAGLGEDLYPAFLEILCAISESGDDASKALVADVLVHAIATGRLPSGKLAAWGARGASSGGGFAQARSLGPIEYVCAWYAQPIGRPSLSAIAFDHAMHRLLSLISVSEDAKALYCAKLRADAEDLMEGALARSTRAVVAELVDAWDTDTSIEIIVERCLAIESGGGLIGLAVSTPPNFVR